MDSDGSNQHAITFTSGVDIAWNPSLSKDGSKIAFLTHRWDGAAWSYGIEVINTDRSGQKTVITAQPQSTVMDPSFAPDGGMIGFTYTFSGNYDIFTIQPDGTNLTNLTNTPSSYEEDPSWSPDGQKIAFTGGGKIWVMNSDGSDRIQLTSTTSWGATWSSDGTKIAYTSSRDGHSQIYVMDSDGSNQINISNNGESDSGPSWSTDGTKIVFSSMRDDASYGEIYRMNADGTDVIRLTTNSTYDGNPSWSP